MMMSENGEHKAMRFNSGKLRYDLLHPFAVEGLVRVLTKGSIKYEARNWERGLSWMSVLASLKRHLTAIERGEDFDPETGELHIDHVQCNAHFLSAYYKIYPQGDDRPVYHRPRIGLDIDGVLADFWGGLVREATARGIEFSDTPIDYHWNFSGELLDLYLELRENREFWLGLDPLVEGDKLAFEPIAYVSARSCPVEFTKDWLLKHKFPSERVVHVPAGCTKSDVCKELKIDWFVDDSYSNFEELNLNGIFTCLADRPHNQKYSVGHRRIYHVNELITRANLRNS